jgi:hypothetical protein
MESTLIQTWDGGYIRDITAVDYTTKREVRARLAKVESALVANLLSRANDVEQSDRDGRDVYHSAALNITIESGLDFVTITEHGGLTLEWTDTPATKVHGGTHPRGYDRIMGIVAEALFSVA